MSSRHPDGRTDLHRYLAMLANAEPAGRFLEIRYALADGRMAQRFIPAERLALAGHLIARRAARTDVYCGVALRGRRAGGRDAVAASQLAFVEIDHPDAERRLARFDRIPAMVVASGSPGHVHAYFQLATPLDVLELERANRRLALALSGDQAAVDAARILRPPSSLNHKHAPPTLVRLIELNRSARYEPAELTAGLADPPCRPTRGPAGGRHTARHPLDRALLDIPTGEYVRVLAGVEPDRAGKIACPFHEDANPSLQLYQDGGWYCFGCRRGGSIYDFASAIFGIPAKGRSFVQLRDRLTSELGATAPIAEARAAG